MGIRLQEVLSEVRRGSPFLWGVGWLHLMLLALALGLSLVDDRMLLGVNIWVKPMKFMASIALYTWTVGLLLAQLRGRSRLAARIVAAGAGTTMLGESACLWIQGIRGATSHFNESTAFDGAIFGAMGILILINTLSAALLFLLFVRPTTSLQPLTLWAIRLGLVVFLLGSAQGAVIIGNGAHTVGAPDGGEGLPFVNWSVEAGDLRIAHALGLHALQLFPLLGVWLSRRSVSGGVGAWILAGAFVFYVAVMGVTFFQALAGQPLMRV